MSVEAPEVLTEKQLTSLIQASRKPRDRLILCFLAHGFRISEVCGKYAIRVMDVNFDVDPVIFTVHGKTRKRKVRGRRGKVRYVPLLRRWLSVFSRFESNLKRFIRKNKLSPEDRLFCVSDRQVRNLIRSMRLKLAYRIHVEFIRTCFGTHAPLCSAVKASPLGSFRKFWDTPA